MPIHEPITGGRKMENKDLSPVTRSGVDVGQGDSPRGNTGLLRKKREMDVGTQ